MGHSGAATERDSYCLQLPGRYFFGIAGGSVPGRKPNSRRHYPRLNCGVKAIDLPSAAVLPMFAVADVPTSAVPFHATEET